VVPLFREQIRLGGPITVTHPDMVRFFMTIPEAAQLVLQAGILGETGKVFALDMGEPVHIVDLAEEMMRLSGIAPGVDMEVQFTGVRPGEKLVEELFTGGKVERTDVHPKVFVAEMRPVDALTMKKGLELLKALENGGGEELHPEMVRCFMSLVPNYRPSPTGMGRCLQPQEEFPEAVRARTRVNATAMSLTGGTQVSPGFASPH
jgi:FlaA1/EpsC-like NDP-sugar epimerase